jgi:hypothetical protein
MGDPSEVGRKDTLCRIKSVRVSKQRYRNPSYNFCLHESAVATARGRLKLFELRPLDSTLPIFVAHWDDATEMIDIDVNNVPGTKWGSKRIAEEIGHKRPHTDRFETWTYLCSLTVSGRKIFVGTIELTGVRIQKHLAFRRQAPKLIVSVKITGPEEQE